MNRASKELLGQGLTSGLNSIVQGYGKRLEGQREEELYRTIQDPNTSLIQKQTAIAKLPKERQTVFLQGLKQQSDMENWLKLAKDAGLGQQRTQNLGPMQGQQPQQQQGLGFMGMQGFAGSEQSPLANALGGQGQQNMEQRDVVNQLYNLPSDQRAILKTAPGPLGKLATAVDSDIKHNEKLQNKEDVAQQTSNDREQQKIREENRSEIRKISEPYKDISALQENVNRLEQAEKIIQNEPASFDENWFRGITQAILEDKDKSTIAELLKTPAQQKLWSLLRPSLKSKEIGGSNPSTREVLIAMSSLPGQYKGKEANIFIMSNLLSDARMNLKRAQEISSINKNKNKDVTPDEFSQQLYERTLPYQESLKNKSEQAVSVYKAKESVKNRYPSPGFVFMLAPDGQLREVRKDHVPAAEQSGGIFVK